MTRIKAPLSKPLRLVCHSERVLTRQELLYLHAVFFQDPTVQLVAQGNAKTYLGAFLDLGHFSEDSCLFQPGPQPIPQPLYRELQMLCAGYSLLELYFGQRWAAATDTGEFMSKSFICEEEAGPPGRAPDDQL